MVSKQITVFKLQVMVYDKEAKQVVGTTLTTASKDVIGNNKKLLKKLELEEDKFKVLEHDVLETVRKVVWVDEDELLKNCRILKERMIGTGGE